MKKLFSLLTLALLTLSAWAQTSTLTFTAACGGTGTADDGVTWTVTSDADESVFEATRGIHYGTGSKAVSYLTLTTSGITGEIKTIKVNAAGASGNAVLDVTVGGNAFGNQAALTKSAAEYTFEGNATGEIVVKLSQESQTKALYCKSITVVYGNGTLPDPEPITGTNYTKVTSLDQIVAGKKYVVAQEEIPTAMASIGKNGGLAVEKAAAIEDNVLTADGALELTLGGTATAASFTYEADGSTYYMTPASKNLKASTDEYAAWIANIDENGCYLTAVIDTATYTLRYNATAASGPFRTYSSGTGQVAYLYVLEDGTTPVDPVDPTTYTEVASLNEANVLADTTAFKFKGDAVVTYQNGRYLYLRDNSGYGLIFNSAGVQPTFNNGDVLTQDWTATKVTYQGYAEYIDYSVLTKNGTNAELAAPQEIDALSADMLNAYVKINHVASVNGNTATLANGSTIALYNTFTTIPNFENGDNYITGIVSQHNGTLQLLSIATDYVAPAATEVANIAAANQVAIGNKFIYTGNVVVAYKHNNQLWLRDDSGSAYAYNATDSTIAQGTTIAPRWGATVATNNDKPQYTELTDFVANGTQEVLPYELEAITMDNYAQYVTIKGVKIASTNVSGGKTNYVLENGLTVRNNFNINFTYDENATYDFIGVVSAYQKAAQLYMTDYVAHVGVAKPVISPESCNFTDQIEVTITCETAGAEVYYTINDGDDILYNGPFTINETATIKAYADLDGVESAMAEVTYTKVEDVTYTLVTNAAQLADGDKIILVNTAVDGDADAMGNAKENNYGTVNVTIAEGKITTHEANVITLGANGNNWTLLANEGYLYAASSDKNYLKHKAEVDSNAIAQIVVSDSAAVFIQFQGANSRNILRYNPNGSNDPLFSCYNETSPVQNPVYIYKAESDAPVVIPGDVNNDGEVGISDVAALIDHLLSGDFTASDNFNPLNADVNQADGIGIADVSALIDLLLNS